MRVCGKSLPRPPMPGHLFKSIIRAKEQKRSGSLESYTRLPATSYQSNLIRPPLSRSAKDTAASPLLCSPLLQIHPPPVGTGTPSLRRGVALAQLERVSLAIPLMLRSPSNLFGTIARARTTTLSTTPACSPSSVLTSLNWPQRDSLPNVRGGDYEWSGRLPASLGRDDEPGRRFGAPRPGHYSEGDP